MRKLVFIILLLTLAASAQTVKVGPMVGPLNGTYFCSNVLADGTTDDAAHINACTAAAVAGKYGELKLPAGQIHVASAINWTNLRGMKVSGAGADVYFHPTNNNITEIKCDTGGVCVDAVGAYATEFRDFSLRIASTYSTPSTIGILQGRTSTNGGSCFSESDRFTRVHIWSDDFAQTANSGRGVVGIMNLGAEEAFYSDVYILADTPMFFASTNVLGTSSPDVALGCAQQSMTNIRIEQSTIKPRGGQALEAWETADVTTRGFVVLMDDPANSGVQDILAFNGASTKNWDARIHVENLEANGSVLSIGSTVFDMNHIEVNIGNSVNSSVAYVAFPSAGHTLGDNYIAFQTLSEVLGTRPFISNTSAQTINGGEFHLGGTKSPLSATNITLNGTKVYAPGFTDGNVTFNAASQYALYSDSGASFRQPVKAVGGLTAGASGSTISDTRELFQSVHYCGTTGTCANTANIQARHILGTITLTAGAATLSGIPTANNLILCTCTDQTTASACKAVQATSTSVAFSGSTTDTIGFQCDLY